MKQSIYEISDTAITETIETFYVSTLSIALNS